MTSVFLGIGLAAIGLAFAWGRAAAAGSVVVVELRCGAADNWRWFGLDGAGRTVSSGFPHRFTSAAEARDAARQVTPGVPCREGGAS